MSAKWIRAKKWDDEHLTGWLWPVKAVLRLFSGIPLAVVLLSLVTFYGILASVPIGLIALAPTFLIYALTGLITLALLGALPSWMLARGLRQTRVSRPARFAIVMFAGIALTVCAAALWVMFVWPRVYFDPVAHTGFRFFGSFVDEYKSVQFRRLPMMEMSELEFYSWWPLRLVLILFVTNMITATVRRIEFSFPYIGVLTVHTGIVTIALGSVYYAAQKQEGDMILLAGEPDKDGQPAVGPVETGFYDNTDTALWVTQLPDKGWEQRRLHGVPRYNDYNLNALQLSNLPPMAKGDTPDRGPLDVRVPEGPTGEGVVDPDVNFRIVGYASHADLISQWLPEDQVHSGRQGLALRSVEAYLDLPPDPNDPDAADPKRPRKTWRLMPELPSQRVEVLEVEGQDLLGIEYTRGMSDQRWRDLSASLPRGTEHALIVRHKASGFEAAYPVKVGQTVTVGPTGYVLEVLQLSPQPPFPIITRGFQGARSSVAVVHVQPPKPTGPGAKPQPPYQRWVYHRFPEINQDMVDAPPDAAGQNSPMPARRAADPDLEIVYVDASILQIYFDELADGAVRALVRLPAGAASITPTVKPGEAVSVSPGLSLKLADRIDDAVRVEFPFSTPTARRDTRAIGNHQRASVAVEVTATVKRKTDTGESTEPWKTTVWVPFTQYARTQTSEAERVVGLPDGRRVRVMFGRVRHEFWPPMGIRLADFEMIPYEHSQMPRDYRSELVVMRRWSNKFEDVKRKTSLNEPLLERTPFQPREGVPGVFNFAARLLSVIAPNQYKFSQAGWDQAGWAETQAATDRGQARRPFARFTILGVGNNPGIYIIAAGAVMMSVGIPWAFYVKPWLMRRRKHTIQQQIARGEFPLRPKPGAEAAHASGDANGLPDDQTRNGTSCAGVSKEVHS
jgi:hypothetical protein